MLQLCLQHVDISQRLSACGRILVIHGCCSFSRRHLGHFLLRHSGHWDILVICLTVVSKLAVIVFIGLYFQTLWPKWFIFVRSFQKYFGLWPKKNRHGWYSILQDSCKPFSFLQLIRCAEATNTVYNYALCINAIPLYFCSGRNQHFLLLPIHWFRICVAPFRNLYGQVLIANISYCSAHCTRYIFFVQTSFSICKANKWPPACQKYEESTWSSHRIGSNKLKSIDLSATFVF